MRKLPVLYGAQRRARCSGTRSEPEMTQPVPPLQLLTAALLVLLPAAPGAVDAASRETLRTIGQTTQRECFEEGQGQRDCVELKLGCAVTDHACLTDDLTGTILRAGPDSAERYAAYLARGVVALNAGQMFDAIADFDAAQAIRPRLATPFVLSGQAYAAAGQHVRALLSFNEAVRRAPQVPAVLAMRAATRQQGGDLDGAIADFTQAIAVVRAGKVAEAADEPLEDLLAARGTVWLAKPDVERARADFHAALALKPGHPAARDGLAKLK